MFETLNYFVELTVSIYFLCIYILFVVNVCEFMPRVDHSVYKDDEDYEPVKAKVVKDKSKSGVSIHEHKGIKTKSGTKRGGSSQKVIKADSGKIEKESSVKSAKPTQSSSKSLVGKSKQGSKSKVETPDEAAESTDEDAKPSEEEATTDEEATPVDNTEEGVQEEPDVEAKLLSKSSVKSSGSKKGGQGGFDALNVSEEKEHPELVRDENDESPAANGGPTQENASTGETVEEIKTSDSKRKSENLSKSSVKRGSTSEDQKKSESQTFNEANTQGGGTTAEQGQGAEQEAPTADQEGQGAEQEGPEAEQDGPTAEQEAEMSSDVQNDPIKKPSKSPEGEVAPTEPHDNPPLE